MAKAYRKRFAETASLGIIIPHGKRRGISNGRKRALELFAAQKGRCWLCGLRMLKKRGQINTVTVDHIIPLSRGGTHSKRNLKGACYLCNKTRGNIMPKEFFAAISDNAGRLALPPRRRG